MQAGIKKFRNYLNARSARFWIRGLLDRMRHPSRPCPYCGATENLELLQTRFLVFQALRCPCCGLIFRNPGEDAARNAMWYQEEFEAGEVSSLPDEAHLAALMRDHFADSELDRSDALSIVEAVRGHGTLLDFGCSWGYTTYEFRERGFEVVGFEIAQARARFGRDKMGLDIVDRMGELESLPAGSFDIIFSSHVLEHVPDLASTFDLFSTLLSPDGVMIHALPHQTRAGEGWILSSRDHVSVLTEDFLRRSLPAHGFSRVACFTEPVELGLLSDTGEWPALRVTSDRVQMFVLAAK